MTITTTGKHLFTLIVLLLFAIITWQKGESVKCRLMDDTAEVFLTTVRSVLEREGKWGLNTNGAVI